MKTNTSGVAPTPVYTHEGGRAAAKVSVHQQLERSVMSCMLFEREFYEDGVDIASRIASLVPKCKPEFVALLAITARTAMKLRHVPLLLVRELAKTKCERDLVRKTLAEVVQRADELAEFLALYWANGRCPVPHCIRLGLSDALRKFNEYNLAKYDRDEKVKLRDVLRVCHPKPANKVQAALWKRVVKRELKTPETWEVLLSAGKDKKETFTKLIKEEKLGALALLRNLRNMEQAGVADKVIRGALESLDVSRVLPFRFIAAARHAVRFESDLESAMFKSIEHLPKLPGDTMIMVDVSGSMDAALSAKSDMTRMDAACGLAMVLRELVTRVSIVSFSNSAVAVPARKGFALRDAIVNSQGRGGTALAQSMAQVAHLPIDRLVIITDEQSNDGILKAPCDKCYLINVASARNGVGYGKKWVHLDGFSEAVVQWIAAYESVD